METKIPTLKLGIDLFRDLHTKLEIISSSYVKHTEDKDKQYNLSPDLSKLVIADYKKHYGKN